MEFPGRSKRTLRHTISGIQIRPESRLPRADHGTTSGIRVSGITVSGITVALQSLIEAMPKRWTTRWFQRPLERCELDVHDHKSPLIDGAEIDRCCASSAA